MFTNCPEASPARNSKKPPYHSLPAAVMAPKKQPIRLESSHPSSGLLHVRPCVIKHGWEMFHTWKLYVGKSWNLVVGFPASHL
jgi:hypothetical protein